MKNGLIRLFYQAEDYFFRSISKECLDFDIKATAYLTGAADENLNIFIARKELESTIDDLLDQSTTFFKSNKVPWSAVISEQYCVNISNFERMENHWQSLGFRFSENSFALFIELNKPRQSCCSPLLTINQVNDNLEDWLLPLEKAFTSTPEIMQQYCQAHQKALNDKAGFYHFTAYKNGNPVAAITLSIKETIARIDDMGTHPSHQKQGIATHLVNYVLEQARLLGATHCFLDAPLSGVSVYEKIGFKPLFKSRIYTQ